MGTEQRYDIYDLFLQLPGAAGAAGARAARSTSGSSRDGHVIMPIDLAQVRREVAELVAAGRRGARCLLPALVPQPRPRASDRATWSGATSPALAVSLSSEVVPELREYERTATTAANAYVQPLMDRYLAKLEAALAERGFAGRFYLMQSSGGMATPATARRFPIRLLESGPAGGALATSFFGRQVGHATT